MSEHKLDCCVVRDPLPSYIEELTEPETTAQVKAHLEGCPPCRRWRPTCGPRLTVERAPSPPELSQAGEADPAHRRRPHRGAGPVVHLVAVRCAVLPLPQHRGRAAGGGGGLRPQPPDSTIQHVAEGGTLRVLGWVEEGRYLYVAYAADNEDNVHGILRMERGLNGKYWPVSSSESPLPLYCRYRRPIHQRRKQLAVLPGGDGCRDIWSAKV